MGGVTRVELVDAGTTGVPAAILAALERRIALPAVA
jgi:hypothetical protein